MKGEGEGARMCFTEEEGLPSRAWLHAPRVPRREEGRVSRRDRTCKVKLAYFGLPIRHFLLSTIQSRFFRASFLRVVLICHRAIPTSHFIAKMAEVPDAGTAPMEVDPAASIGEKITIVSIGAGSSRKARSARGRSLTNALSSLRRISCPAMLPTSRPQHSASKKKTTHSGTPCDGC